METSGEIYKAMDLKHLVKCVSREALYERETGSQLSDHDKTIERLHIFQATKCISQRFQFSGKVYKITNYQRTSPFFQQKGRSYKKNPNN